MRIITYLMLGLILAASLFIPFTSSQVMSGGEGSAHSITRCHQRELSAISGIITASTVEICLYYPEFTKTTSSVKTISFAVQGPDLPTGGTAAFTPTTTSSSGCTISSWTTITEIIAARSGASSYEKNTMTSGECNAVLTYTVTAGAIPVTLGRVAFAMNIIAETTAFTNTLTGAITNTVTGAMTNTLTGAVTNTLTGTIATHADCDIPVSTGPTVRHYALGGCYAAVITGPDIITSRTQSGTYTADYIINFVADAGVYTESQARQATLFSNPLDGATPFEAGDTCTVTPSLGATSGTYDMDRTDTRYRTQIWKVHITFTGSGCTALFTLSGAFGNFMLPIVVRSDGAIHQDPLTGTINVVNSGGQSVAITSWPSLNAALSGTVNVVNSGALAVTNSGTITINDDAGGWAIHQDPLSGTINVVNSGSQSVAITSWPELMADIDADLTGSLVVTMPDGLVVTIDSWPELQAVLDGDIGVDILDDTTADGMLTVPVTPASSFNSTFENSTFNVTNQSGFTSALIKGNVMLLLFLLAIAVAEWKKDAIYHLLAALIGALTLTSLVDDLGVPRLIILALVVYQLWRMFAVMGNNRNNIAKGSDT